MEVLGNCVLLSGWSSRICEVCQMQNLLLKKMFKLKYFLELFVSLPAPILSLNSHETSSGSGLRVP